MDNDLICPTDGVQINETKVRLVAGLVLLTAVTYLLTNWIVLPLLLVADFGLRSFDKGQYSLLAKLADGLIKLGKLPYKGTDQAPKRFAARIGLVVVITIASLHLAGVSTIIPVAMLTVFAALESLAGFCAGCYAYTWYVQFFPKTT